MKLVHGAQKNTNCAMLPGSGLFVHILRVKKYTKNAQNFGRSLRILAFMPSGLDWYGVCDDFMLTLVSEQP